MLQPIPKIFETLCTASDELLEPAKLWNNDRLRLSITPQQKGKWVAQAYALNRAEEVGASKEAALSFWTRLPERKELGYGRWAIAQTDFNAVVLAAAWGLDRITFDCDATKLVFEYLLLRFTSQTMTARMMAAYKEEGVLPPLPENWLEHHEFPLADYQRVATIAGLSATEGLALFMEQGTGKTPTAIALLMHEAAAKYKATGQMYRAIIACPRNVKVNWQREIHKFAVIPGKVVVLRGTKLHRMKQLVEVADTEGDSQFSVAISSYEAIPRTWEGIQLFSWDLGIADESDMFKSTYAKRAKQMMRLRDICTKRLALTGTPINNSILDLYYQLEWLGEGLSGFSDWKTFRAYYNKYASPSTVSNYQGAKVLIGFQNLPLLHERLARCSFRITKKEALPSLPDKVYDIVETPLSKEQSQAYGKMARELAIELEGALEGDDARKVTINNVLVKLLRLAQITAGYINVDQQFADDGTELLTKDQRLHWFKDVPKLEELVDAIKDKSPDDKTIIWTCWVPTIERIAERLRAEGIKVVTYFGGTSDADRLAAERLFNFDTEVKVFIGNPAAGGVGMNLPGYDAAKPENYTTNANHTIYYASSWSFRYRAQSEDRNHGRGRCRMPVRYTDYVTPGTIDMEILSALRDKKQTALEAQDVKVIMQRLLAFNPEDSED